MKKLIIGICVVVALTTVGATTYGAVNSLVGKKVQSEAPVIVNGEELGNAIIIDGVSYLPVRKVSESLGVDVSYEDKKVIVIDEKKKLSAKIKSLTARIDELYENIETSKFVLERFGGIGENVTEDVAEVFDGQLSDVEAGIARYKTQIAELEAERDAVIAELATK